MCKKTPPEAINALNVLNTLSELMRKPLASSKLNMSCFVAIIDSQEMTISYANAGHCPPYLMTFNNGTLDQKRLVLPGTLLYYKNPTFKLKHLDIKPNDILVCYTDGLTEGRNPANEMFGSRRLRKLLTSLETNMSAEEIRDWLLASANNFYEDRQANDDITLVISKM